MENDATLIGRRLHSWSSVGHYFSLTSTLRNDMHTRLDRMMRAVFGSLMVASVGWGGAVSAGEAAHEFCPRPAPGSVVEEPEDLRSENGVLKLDLTVRDEKLKDGATRYCYLLGD